jgi:hypothetical protein
LASFSGDRLNGGDRRQLGTTATKQIRTKAVGASGRLFVWNYMLVDGYTNAASPAIENQQMDTGQGLRPEPPESLLDSA